MEKQTEQLILSAEDIILQIGLFSDLLHIKELVEKSNCEQAIKTNAFFQTHLNDSFFQTAAVDLAKMVLLDEKKINFDYSNDIGEKAITIQANDLIYNKINRFLTTCKQQPELDKLLTKLKNVRKSMLELHKTECTFIFNCHRVPVDGIKGILEKQGLTDNDLLEQYELINSPIILSKDALTVFSSSLREGFSLFYEAFFSKKYFEFEGFVQKISLSYEKLIASVGKAFLAQSCFGIANQSRDYTGLLINPIQRLPRYNMFAKQFVELFEESNLLMKAVTGEDAVFIEEETLKQARELKKFLSTRCKNLNQDVSKNEMNTLRLDFLKTTIEQVRLKKSVYESNSPERASLEVLSQKLTALKSFIIQRTSKEMYFMNAGNAFIIGFVDAVKQAEEKLQQTKPAIKSSGSSWNMSDIWDAAGGLFSSGANVSNEDIKKFYLEIRTEADKLLSKVHLLENAATKRFNKELLDNSTLFKQAAAESKLDASIMFNKDNKLVKHLNEICQLEEPDAANVSPYGHGYTSK